MPQQGESEDYDVVVVGSGAGAMVAALRASDLGLSAIIVEKANRYGGTSAISGGCTWIPLNDGADDDNIDKAKTYLRAVMGPDGNSEAVDAYVKHAAEVTKYLERHGVVSIPIAGYPDYYSEAPGATVARARIARDMDGAALGDEFFRMRENNQFFMAFDRYALDFDTAAVLSGKRPGWQWSALKMLARYWLDIPWRRKTRRDRRLVMGRALVGSLRKAMIDRGLPLQLNTELHDLELQDGRVTAALCKHHGRDVRIGARKGVILAAGGFEHDQAMRDRHMAVHTNARASMTPRGWNVGDAIRIGQKHGAAVDGMANAWWSPSVMLPSSVTPNIDIPYGLFFERGRPGSIIVNRRGERYANEAASYDRFALAMIDEEKRTGLANPSWMIFDARFRSKHPVGGGGLMPGWVQPDRSLPSDWWDSVIYRADTLPELAAKIGLPEAALLASVEEINESARTGVDERFGRGSTPYDLFLGEMGHKPNPCLGPIRKAPFYAVPIEVGDIGTKGGLKVNASAQVLDREDRPITGLYAIGNTTRSVFGAFYPGAGATLGPAITFGFLASTHIAQRASNQL